MGIVAIPGTVRDIETMAHRALRPFVDEDAWLEEYNDGAVPIRRFLYGLCRLAQVDAAVELGIARGFTTLHLAAGTNQRVVGVDIAPDWAYLTGNQALWEARWPGRVSLVIGDSIVPETIEKVEAALDGLRVGLLFIDSLHRAGQALAEWAAYCGLLAPGAVIAMDDIIDPPEMEAVYRAIPGEHIDLHFLHEVRRPGPVPQTVGFGIIIT